MEARMGQEQNGVEILAGDPVYFKPKGAPRKRRGVVLGGNDVAGWEVLGRRQAEKAKPDVFHLSRAEVWTVGEHKAERQPTGVFEAKSAKGRQLTAAEINRRAEVGAARFTLSEDEFIKHPVVLRRMRGTLARLAASNQIGARYTVTAAGLLDNADFEGLELYSEYAFTLLLSFRRETSKAVSEELDAFRGYLEGETAESRIAMTLFRDSETAAIRYLKKRQADHRRFSGGDRDEQLDGQGGDTHGADQGNDLRGWLALKKDIAGALRRLRIENRAAARTILLRYALGQAVVSQGYKSIAGVLERSTGVPWSSKRVAQTHADGLNFLRRYLS